MININVRDLKPGNRYKHDGVSFHFTVIVKGETSIRIVYSDDPHQYEYLFEIFDDVELLLHLYLEYDEKLEDLL